jgi:hypothetical protein
MQTSLPPKKLNLKAGEWVEVRSQHEILATLDENGRFENAPFMPEMLQFCGQKLRVFKRADKTCDPAHEPWSIRRVKNSVHLQDARCDGQGHGGCQAGCLIFWKEVWLKRADDNVISASGLQPRPVSVPPLMGIRNLETITSASEKRNSEGETIYTCQATALRDYTSPMASWDPRQYFRDLRSGNLATGLAGDSRGNRLLEFFLGLNSLFRALTISLFNQIPRRIKGPAYPLLAGTLEGTPSGTLDLQPGELVQVRNKEEIMATLNRYNRNRGMLFDGEMIPYCGGIYRVLRRVHHIIDEKTGRMLAMKSPCIVLEGVVCKSDFHRLCPRAIYPYWRENWLKRANQAPAAQQADQVAESCGRQ